MKGRGEEFHKRIERADRDIRDMDISEEERSRLLGILNETCANELELFERSRKTEESIAAYSEDLAIIDYNLRRGTKALGGIIYNLKTWERYQNP